MAVDNSGAANSGGTSNGGGAGKMLKRYGPIALVVIVIAGIIGFASMSGGDDDDGDDVEAAGGGGDTGDLPMTYQEAEEAGTVDDIEWGDNCDTTTGRLKIPVHNAYPCVEPFEGDNGGETSPGVTADSIIIAQYKGEPDPLQQSLVEGAGADTDPNAVNQTERDYVTMFADVAETYGRTLDVRVVEASGSPSDATAAQADAQKVIDMGAFAAIGGPGQTPAWWQEIVAAGIVCMCGTAESETASQDNAPYLWPTGPTPEQADAHLLELVGKQLVGKPAEYAGDPALQSEERVFGWVQAETETDEYRARNDAFDAALQEEYGGEVAARSTYLFDPANSAEIATTVIARMKEAGVTTIIISTDPLIPAQITAEATKQNYFPEWVIGPSVLADTTIFGRTFDQQQWTHAIGLSLPTARAERELGDSYLSYVWYFGKEPPINSQATQYPLPERLLLGIHLAGPDLTPENFRRGMFRFPPDEQGLSYTYVSWGDRLWPETDYNTSDDATVIWWDPTATGEDEAGNAGTGMLRYVDGGKRFLPGEWPTEPIPFFEEEGSVTVYTERPDAAPDYPPWPGSPAAG
jgi:hypothetical protein